MFHFIVAKLLKLYLLFLFGFAQGFFALLPQMLQSQYSYEKPLVSNGEQLQHSPLLRALISLTIGLNLINLLCLEVKPLHHIICHGKHGSL